MTTGFIQAMLGTAQETAFRMADRIRSRMALLEERRTIGGVGEPVVVSFRRLKRTRDRGPPRGREPLVMALFDSVQVVTLVVPNRKIQTIAPLVLSKVRPGSVLLYINDIEKRRLLGYGFDRRLSKKFELESATSHPEPMNLAISYWTNFHRTFRATYGKARYTNISKYLGEFNFRFNRRMRPDKIFWDIVYSPDI